MGEEIHLRENVSISLSTATPSRNLHGYLASLQINTVMNSVEDMKSDYVIIM